MIEKFAKLLNNESLFKNIAATIEHAMVRGSRSRYLVEESTTIVGGVKQVFKKEGNIVIKHYRPSKGTIDTAFFKGDKAKLLEKDRYYEGITQPDKLVNQEWLKMPLGEEHIVEHSMSITEPLEQPNMVELVRGIHKPQNTTDFIATRFKDKISYETNLYPSRISSSCWSAGVDRI